MFCNNFPPATPSPLNPRQPRLLINIRPSTHTLSYTLHLFECLAEEDDLQLVVDGQDTSTSNTTENVGTSTLEERADTLLSDDLAASIQGGLVLDGLTRSHHHTTTDSIQWVRSNTSTSGDTPAEKEGGKEVTLKRTDKDDRLERVVHTEVETTVDDDTEDGRTETTVETGNTIRGKGLLVNINQAVELTLTTRLSVLGIVGKTGTSVVERVDEKEGSGTSSLLRFSVYRGHRRVLRSTYTTRGQVTHHPLGISITLLLVGEHFLVGITESKVQCLGWEVSDNVGSVTTPQGSDTLSGSCAAETLHDTIVLSVKTASLDHFILCRCISGLILSQDKFSYERLRYIVLPSAEHIPNYRVRR